MRKHFLIALVLVAMSVFATSAFALEKTVAPMQDLGDNWNATNTVTLQYYNGCTGYVWLFSGWNTAGETASIRTFGHGTGCTLSETWVAVYNALPQGYGYTGTATLIDGTACSDPVIASQPFSPATGTAFNIIPWAAAVNDPFSVMITMQSPVGAPANSSALATLINNQVAASVDPCTPADICKSQGNPAHSFYHGIGSPSGGCADDAGTVTTTALGLPGCYPEEWQSLTFLKCPVSVEQESWGKIKTLYE